MELLLHLGDRARLTCILALCVSLACLGADPGGTAAPGRVPAPPSRSARLAFDLGSSARLVAPGALCYNGREADEALAVARNFDFKPLRLAINDLMTTWGDKYPDGRRYLERLEAIEKALQAAAGQAGKDAPALEAARGAARDLLKLRREALLANPLLNFDRLLLVKRGVGQMGLPTNWQSNSCLPPVGYDNEIAVLSPVAAEGRITTLYRPEGGRFVGDVDLHFDADRMLFSMPGKNNRWQVFELNADGTLLRQLPLIDQGDVDNYDACYLPGGDVIFTSTAPFVGVPCVTGASHVASLFRYDAATLRIRQLSFGQDHDWCPAVLNNGRVLYLRWEYSDVPHFVGRILFHMNPDGTEQMEYYGSNSYWPNAMFYARAVPDHPTKFVAVVGGHHDVPRMGELVVFDPAAGRHEADGALQRIPGRGKKVEPIIRDTLVSSSWPKYLHPWPLSEKYFLVSCKPTASAEWGIYLVDVFDNVLLVREERGYALLEPVPFRKTRRPPAIADKVQLDRKDAVVYVTDLYRGPGLDGVPRGSVKKLRLFTYQFAYHGMGGQVNRVGLDGPWDVKRIIGTVDVEPDGSAMFRVPANTPISVQPLDDRGQALQLMRSWLTAMPGEVLSCVGCHERQNTPVPNRRTMATSKPPSEIAPWYGPTRGFSFKREVQPVLDKHCTPCHNPGAPKRPDGRTLIDLTPRSEVHPQARNAGYNNGTQFTPSYLALRSFVRSPSIESDMHMLGACEYHAETTLLIQMLRKGHHGVELDAEAWDRLITWIDLSAPAHGTWREIVGDQKVMHQRDRRREMQRLYAGIDEDPEVILPPPPAPASVAPRPAPPSAVGKIDCPGWPFDAAQARQRQAAAGSAEMSVDLGQGAKLELVRIPPGEFVMGEADGCDDERPPARVKIDQPVWMGKFEVTNEQFARFNPSHDSRLESGDFLQFSEQERGYPVNGPRQPVVRVSWLQAMDFCRWLSGKTGLNFTLPTEAQWEYACRAGTALPLWYGKVDQDFSKLANLADASLRKVDTFGWDLPSGAVPPWRPADERFNDNARVSANVGGYSPNPWGLHDMHGNAAEWVLSIYRPYPYRDDDGRNAVGAGASPAGRAERRVVRGGSWYYRPQQARSAFRLHYPAWQRVYDVGFRVVCPVASQAPRVAAGGN